MWRNERPSDIWLSNWPWNFLGITYGVSKYFITYWISESGSHELSKRISSVASNSDSKLLFSKFSFGIKHILKIYEYSNLKKEKKSIILHDL